MDSISVSYVLKVVKISEQTELELSRDDLEQSVAAILKRIA